MEQYQIPFEAFQLQGLVLSATPNGNGHINRTFHVRTDSGDYLVQRINTDVFPDVDGLMNNIKLVSAHIRKRLRAEGKDVDRGCMTIIPTQGGKLYARTESGCWRAFYFIKNCRTLEAPRSPEDFYMTARAFGHFQAQLSDFPAQELVEVIPNFHNTPKRLRDLWEAEKADKMGRVKEVQKELDFIREREAFGATIQSGIEKGTLPLAVTHNDTKLNNLLFDKATMEPLCVIDLDTVMPGSTLYDFGDSIRFGAATADEDEKDLSKMECSLPMFDAFVRGWMESTGDVITPAERALLPESARILTLECGSRFLADYLNGDTYFATSRPGQNLDRCRTQLKLVADMEKKDDEMHKIVDKY